MTKALIIHLDCGPAGLEWAKVCGLSQRVSPGIQVSAGNLTIDNPLSLSAYLYTTVPYWPDGSVFLSMPNTPSASRIVAVRLRSGSIILSPDDGTSTLCASRIGIRDAYEIDPDQFGADSYAIIRCGAMLAAGLPLEKAGAALSPEDVFQFTIPQAVTGNGVAEGQVFMLLKTFGNLTFTISIEDFEKAGFRTGDALRVTFTRGGKIEYQKEMTFQPSFGYVPEGEPVVFNGSSGYLDIGLNKKSFIDEAMPQILKAENPLDFYVRIEKL